MLQSKQQTDEIKMTESELFVLTYFGLSDKSTTEKTEIKTDYGQIVNILEMFTDYKKEDWMKNPYADGEPKIENYDTYWQFEKHHNLWSGGKFM